MPVSDETTRSWNERAPTVSMAPVSYDQKNIMHAHPQTNRCLPAKVKAMENRRASSSPLKSNCRVYLTNHDRSLSHKKSFSPNKSKMELLFSCIFLFDFFSSSISPFKRPHAFLPCAPSVRVVSSVICLCAVVCHNSG